MSIAKFKLLLLLSFAASACAGVPALNNSTSSWKEEVVLHDGKVVVVERFFHLGEYPTADSHNRSPLDQTLTFTLPETNKRISWKTEYKNNISEPNSLTPLLLDVVDGIPYLATSPAGCIAYNKWARPNPPYILFKYIHDEWQRIPLEAFPSELVQANLMSKPDARLIKSYYTVAQVQEQMSGRNIAAYAKTILREVISGGITSCEELVYYKCGWGAPGEFNRKYFERTCK
jgi:hypothetical protein